MTWEQIQERLNERYASWPSPAVALFEVSIIVAVLLVYRYLNARVLRVRQHFALVAIGVFLLEFFTGPMWHTEGLGWWAFVYSDVTWIFTIAWSAMIVATVYGVDRVGQGAPIWQRFVAYLVVLTPMALLFEGLNKALEVRTYSPEVLEAAGPWRIPVLDVPAAGLYYIPVFMALILSFYKHWLPTIEPGGESRRRVSPLRRFLLIVMAVFMFEIIVEPMATNQNFPAWSYVYHDITIVMTGLWVVLVAVCTFVVDRLLPNADYRLRFGAYLGLIAIIATPIEGWFINAGYRVYGPSATADFIGVRTLIGDLPIEVVAAIPIYLALVISFVRYWDGSTAQRLGMVARPTPSPGFSALDAAGPVPS
jgi:hypothetical protein